jgi:hypothetical protein
MKNGDLPAMPNLASSGIATSERELAEMLSEGRVTVGLTKRETFAMAAMQGLLSSLTPDDDLTPRELARCAALNADALLAELERGK